PTVKVSSCELGVPFPHVCEPVVAVQNWQAFTETMGANAEPVSSGFRYTCVDTTGWLPPQLWFASVYDWPGVQLWDGSCTCLPSALQVAGVGWNTPEIGTGPGRFPVARL